MGALGTEISEMREAPKSDIVDRPHLWWKLRLLGNVRDELGELAT
jgi:hypothetical protein